MAFALCSASTFASGGSSRHICSIPPYTLLMRMIGRRCRLPVEGILCEVGGIGSADDTCAVIVAGGRNALLIIPVNGGPRWRCRRWLRFASRSFLSKADPVIVVVVAVVVDGPGRGSLSSRGVRHDVVISAGPSRSMDRLVPYRFPVRDVEDDGQSNAPERL